MNLKEWHQIRQGTYTSIENVGSIFSFFLALMMIDSRAKIERYIRLKVIFINFEMMKHLQHVYEL